MKERSSPSGLKIALKPDALGRVREATAAAGLSPFANKKLAVNVSYHTNGVPSALEYRNGQKLTQTLNARHLLETSKTQKTPLIGDATVVFDHVYYYGPRPKIIKIEDAADLTQNRTFIYDGEGRLRYSKGSWGAGCTPMTLSIICARNMSSRPASPSTTTIREAP
jgi:hypothetical protein